MATTLEVKLLSCGTPGVLLGCVAHAKDVLVPEGRVVVKAQLCVGSDELAVICLGQGVHLCTTHTVMCGAARRPASLIINADLFVAWPQPTGAIRAQQRPPAVQ